MKLEFKSESELVSESQSEIVLESELYSQYIQKPNNKLDFEFEANLISKQKMNQKPNQNLNLKKNSFTEIFKV